MKLKAICNRCGKKWYDKDIPNRKTIFDITDKHKDKCRVRTRKKRQECIRYTYHTNLTTGRTWKTINKFY